MSFNGSGVFVINSAGQPVVSITLITAAVHNALMADLATGLSNCVLKDGTQTVTQNIALNDKKITGLGAGTARTDAASLATIQNGTGVYVATVGGTVDVITLTPSPAITAYVAGQTFRFIASGPNTTNVTVAVSGLVAKAITKNGTTALSSGDFVTGGMVEITYDGTRFVLAAMVLPTSGAWVPSVGGNASYTSQVGTWTRVGRLVFVNGAIIINVLGTGSTSVISGLPLAPVAATALTVAQSVLAITVVSIAGITSGSTIELYSRTVASAADSGNAVLGNGKSLTVSGCYETNE